MSTEQVARDFARLVGERDWAGLTALLAPTRRMELRYDGMAWDRDGWLRAIPTYTRFQVEDLVASEDRAVLRAYVHAEGDDFYLACFLTVRDGLLTELVGVGTLEDFS